MTGGCIGGWKPLQSLRLEDMEDDFIYICYRHKN